MSVILARPPRYSGKKGALAQIAAVGDQYPSLLHRYERMISMKGVAARNVLKIYKYTREKR